MLDRASLRKRGKDGNRAAAVGDLDRLAGLDTSKQLAGPLSQFSHSHASHVLVVAHDISVGGESLYHTRYHTYMIKTTIYLPEPLKRQLQRLAKRSGTSEAQLIRDAIEQAIQEKPAPRPRLPLFASGDPTLAERVDEALAGFGE